MNKLTKNIEKVLPILQDAMLKALINLGGDVKKLDLFCDNPYPEVKEKR